MAIHEPDGHGVKDVQRAKDGGAREANYNEQTDADRIRELILRTGLSQRAAARELEVDDRTLRYWCSGQIKPPKIAFLALERLIDMQRQVE